jgi:hypothetical protein
MSPTEKDRKLQSILGKTFPPGSEYDQPQFADVIAKALKADFGGSPAVIKTISRLTRTNQRAVRNWFEGRNGPSGEHLMTLMRHSDEVLHAVLDLSGHGDLALTGSLSDLKAQLLALVKMIDDLKNRRDSE